MAKRYSKDIISGSRICIQVIEPFLLFNLASFLECWDSTETMGVIHCSSIAQKHNRLIFTSPLSNLNQSIHEKLVINETMMTKSQKR